MDHSKQVLQASHLNESIVGVDVGGTKAEFWAPGSSAEHLLRVETGPQFQPEQLEQAIDRQLNALPRRPSQLGLAIPGLVQNGKVVSCDVLPELTGWCPNQEQWGVESVVMLNDVDAALTAEQLRWSEDHSGIVVFVGTAVGAAIQICGKRLQGQCGWAGELGYMPVQVADDVLRLDEISGGAALLAQAKMPPDELNKQAASGNQEVIRILEQGGRQLGLALSAVLNLLNPGSLTLGGGTLRYPQYREEVLKTIERHTLPESFAACPIRIASTSERLVAQGAAIAAARRSVPEES